MSVGTGRDDRLLIYGGFALTIAVIPLYRPWDLHNAFMIGVPFGRDFVNFWLGGSLALHGRLDVLLDLPAYNHLIADRFAHAPDDSLVFSYAPNILPFLVPFGALPYAAAAIAWAVINVALLAWSTRLITADKRAVLAACLSPAAVMMVAFGHFGGALAPCAITAINRASQRPFVAGLCLALISVKPQLAVSLGVLMLLQGYWRAVAWSMLCATGMIGLSIMMFGLAPWIGFFKVTVPFHSWLINDYVRGSLRTMLSVYGAARLDGLSFGVAQAIQIAFSLIVIAGTTLLVRRDGINPRTLALLLLTAMVALPYYEHYDLAIIASALAVSLFAAQPATARPFLGFFPAGLLWIAPAMAVVFGMNHWPVANVAVAGVLVIGIVLEWRRATPSTQSANAQATPRLGADVGQPNMT